MSALELQASRVAYRGLLVAVESKVPAPATAEDADMRPKAALYLLVTGAGVPGALAAQVYGCSKQYVSRIVRDVEWAREAPAFDATIAELERRIFDGSST